MFYIFDTTQKTDKGETPVFTYKTTGELIAHLEVVTPRLLGKTRAQLMADAADLGFGEDDLEGKAFFSVLEEYFNMGTVNKDGQPIKCNIFTAKEFSAPEYGQ